MKLSVGLDYIFCSNNFGLVPMHRFEARGRDNGVARRDEVAAQPHDIREAPPGDPGPSQPTASGQDQVVAHPRGAEHGAAGPTQDDAQGDREPARAAGDGAEGEARGGGGARDGRQAEGAADRGARLGERTPQGRGPRAQRAPRDTGRPAGHGPQGNVSRGILTLQGKF